MQKRKAASNPAKSFRQTLKRAKVDRGLFRRSKGSLIRKNIESNFVDSGQLILPCDTTGAITLINVIPQNATVNGRVGKRCLLKTVQLSGFFYPNGTAIMNNCCVYLVLDRQSNGAAIPAVTDVLVTANANDFPNDAKKPRYKILRAMDAVLSGATSATAVPANDLPSANINTYTKVNYVMEFNSTAATGVQATIEKGALYLVAVGSAAAGATAATCQIYCRTRFTEDY